MAPSQSSIKIKIKPRAWLINRCPLTAALSAALREILHLQYKLKILDIQKSLGVLKSFYSGILGA